MINWILVISQLGKVVHNKSNSLLKAFISLLTNWDIITFLSTSYKVSKITSFEIITIKLYSVFLDFKLFISKRQEKEEPEESIRPSNYLSMLIPLNTIQTTKSMLTGDVNIIPQI